MIDTAAAFELIEATVRFPTVTAIDRVSLRICEGEHVALVGPSGSGKSTFLRLLNGTMRPTSGSVNVIGQDTARLTPRELRGLRCRIGFIHQDHGLVPNIRVLRNVITGRVGSRSLLPSLRMMMMPTWAEAREIHTLLERVGIAEKLYERTDRLSGGQQQRVAIARALYQQPDSILADEPVSSVDPSRAEETIRLLTSVAEEAGLTLCVSLHNLELARKFFPRLIGIREGSIVFDRPASELSDSVFQQLYRLTGETIDPSTDDPRSA